MENDHCGCTYRFPAHNESLCSKRATNQQTAIRTCTTLPLRTAAAHESPHQNQAEHRHSIFQQLHEIGLSFPEQSPQAQLPTSPEARSEEIEPSTRKLAVGEA